VKSLVGLGVWIIHIVSAPGLELDGAYGRESVPGTAIAPPVNSYVAFLSSRMREVTSLAGFAFRSCSLFDTGIRFRDAFRKEDEVPKRVSDADALRKNV
jgi:hypothetical protein